MKIGNKHHADNEEFVKVWRDISNVISKEECEVLVRDTANDIKQVVRGRKAAYGWSGGKDSQALQIVCEQAGIHRGVCAIASNLMFPDVLPWLKSNKPIGVEFYDYPQYDIRFLSNHAELLFPYPSKNKWAQLVQINAQDRYCKANGIDVMLLGRRLLDGNCCGKGRKLFKKGKCTIYNPIASWTHEQVLGVIYYYLGRNILPTYYYRDGFILSAEIWPNLVKTPNKRTGWQRIYDIDNSLVENAAQYIASAKEFINTNKK